MELQIISKHVTLVAMNSKHVYRSTYLAMVRRLRDLE